MAVQTADFRAQPYDRWKGQKCPQQASRVWAPGDVAGRLDLEDSGAAERFRLHRPIQTADHVWQDITETSQHGGILCGCTRPSWAALQPPALSRAASFGLDNSKLG